MINAKETLKKYILSAKNKNWDDMINYLQITFKQEHSKKLIIERLKGMYDYMSIIDCEILEEKVIKGMNNAAVKDIPVVIKYTVSAGDKKFIGKVKSKTFLVRLICEERAYGANVNGVWGVNPISALRTI